MNSGHARVFVRREGEGRMHEQFSREALKGMGTAFSSYAKTNALIVDVAIANNSLLLF